MRVLLDSTTRPDGTNLVEKLLSGSKWATTRTWKDRTIAGVQKSRDKGIAIRLQTNYGNWTLVAWALVDRLVTGPPSDVVTPELVREVGCGGWTVDRYIDVWCTEKVKETVDGKEVETAEVCKTVTVTYFSRLWDRNGIEIIRCK